MKNQLGVGWRRDQSAQLSSAEVNSTQPVGRSDHCFIVSKYIS